MAKTAKPPPVAQPPKPADWKIGNRVRMKGTQRRGTVVDWPSDAVEAMQALQASHIPVMPIKAQFSEHPELQFWPKKQVAGDGQPDNPPAAPRRALDKW